MLDVLLDLTDRYRMHAELFPGEYVAGDWTAAAAGGGPITLSLPLGRAVRPGARGTDWLMLLVAEERFSSDAFLLPRLREAPAGRRPTSTLRHHRHPRPARFPRGHPRHGPDTTVALDWTTSVLEITTSVPAPER